MCGRMACALAPDCLSKACAYKRNNSKAYEKPEWVGNSVYTFKPSYNISPSSTVCVMADKIHFDSENLTEYTLVPMRWGMLPIWSTDDKSQFHTHNARIETILQSKIYRKEFIEGRRCVVVCEGFYEWQTTQKSSNRQPYFIYNDYISSDKEKSDEPKPEKPLLQMAGIFNKIRDSSTQNIKYTCSIITKESDERLNWCHHRMPIVLNTFADVEKWISVSDEEPKEILSFLKDYQYDKKNADIVLHYHAVDKQYVNNSKFDDKKCTERMSVKRKSSSATLDTWFKKK